MSDLPVGWITPPDTFDPRFPATQFDRYARPIALYVGPDGNLRLSPTCRTCGGDGVVIDDDPESTRSIVNTCPDCREPHAATERTQASDPHPKENERG